MNDADRREDDPTRSRLGEIQGGYRRFARRVSIVLALLVVVQLGLGSLSIYLIGQNDRRSKENSEAVRQIRLRGAELRKLSLSNCSDLREQTQGLYKLLLILKAIVDHGALGPDAKVEITEPKQKECHVDNPVPSSSGRPR